MPRENRIVYPGKPKPRRPFARRVLVIPGLIAALAVLGFGLWYLLNLPYLRVDEVEVVGVRQVSAGDIERAVRDDLSGAVWLLFPRASFFLVSTGALERRLRERFREIQEIDVSKRFPDRLTARVTERTLWGVYCVRSSSTVPPGQAGEPAHDCAYLDTRGVAYEELSRFAGWLLPVIYGAAPPRLGDPAVPAGTLELFNGARAALASLGGELLSLSRSTTTPDDVRLALAEGWSVWVTASRPIPEWMNILKTVLEKEIGERRSELDYMDLRFGAKVFYKFK